ncbi:probable activating signal cointegrator 1 at N-terminal half [Coccomyxa sp. Obi]|nr:probable activating signal cointegrator 1 at N-terminal half [Coccomyxa sp. Obi]
MAVKGNREWLQRSLAKAVGWDADMIQGIADAIATADTREEIDELLQDYLGGSKEVHSVVQQFLGETSKQGGPSVVQQRAGGRDNAAAGKPRNSSRQAAARERPAGSMTIIHKQDKRKGTDVSSAAPEAPLLDRAVANCLCCGKVYHCRDMTNDVRVFVESGGVCTFCGAKVALSSQESSEVRPPFAERSAAPDSQGQPASSTPTSAAADDKVAEAVAFKNRLVDYDRNASKRTTVVDDQSDFFEIDSNAWLSDEERQQLKDRQRAIEEAEQSRRRAVTVSFDLLGRQVIMAEDEQRASSNIAAAAANARDAATAAAVTAAEIPQGGGSSDQAAAGVAGLGDDVPMVLRIRPNPTLSGPAPVFMPRASGQIRGPSSKPATRVQQQQHQLPQRDSAGRLQHDDVFGEEVQGPIAVAPTTQNGSQSHGEGGGTDDAASGHQRIIGYLQRTLRELEIAQVGEDEEAQQAMALLEQKLQELAVAEKACASSRSASHEAPSDIEIASTLDRLEEQLNTLEGKLANTDEQTRHILGNSTALWPPKSQSSK